MSDEQKAANKARMANHYIEQYQSRTESSLAAPTGSGAMCDCATFSALVTAIKEIKRTALETKDARSGLSRIVRLCIDAEKASGTWTRIDRRSKHYGYNCAVCNEPIKEPQATEHTDDGLAHAKCCLPNTDYPTGIR